MQYMFIMSETKYESGHVSRQSRQDYFMKSRHVFKVIDVFQRTCS